MLCGRCRSRRGTTRESSGDWPAVDIFICSYNEPLDVIERLIIPALAIDYPNYTLWVCDDTRRHWLKRYCARSAPSYITRPDNAGAKAGNLNNALAYTAGLTNAPLILVLDADFAVQPNILRRTVGLFRDERAGVIQTPQFFFNPDPIQHNLTASESWVDDQRIFFDVFQPAKDAWGCAFCVGTSFLVRRDLVTQAGGFPDDAICEDINLTYTLMRQGYATHWLNERLSAGLSAEGLPEYISQRTRWCLGTIQVALLKDGPFRGAGYSLMQRLHYLHGMLNWLCKPFIVLMLMAPSIYWFFDMPAFYADYMSFLLYGAPALLALWIYSAWVSGKRTLPLFMEVTHIMTALAVTVTIASSAVRPFGRPFKVTDKGGDRSASKVRWKMATGFGAIFALSAVSVLWSFVSPYGASEISPLDYFNLFGPESPCSSPSWLSSSVSSGRAAPKSSRSRGRASSGSRAHFTTARLSASACIRRPSHSAFRCRSAGSRSISSRRAGSMQAPSASKGAPASSASSRVRSSAARCF